MDMCHFVIAFICDLAGLEKRMRERRKSKVLKVLVSKKVRRLEF